MKKLICVAIVLSMLFSFCVVAFAAEKSSNKESLSFDADGNFRIMHVTDTHLDFENVDASVCLIAQACDRERPDMAVITGDNVENCADSADTKILIDKLMDVFDARNIPVAVTFGNHDSEAGAMSREELMAYYNTHSSSVSVDDGEALTGCGTYNVPIMSSDGTKVAFNIWVFDSNASDGAGHYDCVHKDQVEWYKSTSDLLTAANGGKKVNSLAFQHIIVGEIYDALKPVDKPAMFAFEHLYEPDKYYMFDPERTNFGTLNETPCPGYSNYGQFDAMVEKGDVLAIYTGHDHTNAFGVRYKGIDITNSLSTRYNGDSFSAGYGYRIIDVSEKNTSVYSTYVVHWYDMFTLADLGTLKSEADEFTFRTAVEVTFKGLFQKLADVISRGFAEVVTGRKVTY